jgi:hypothetical protein
VNCRKATELISRRMDQPLPGLAAFSLHVHLLTCSSCKRFERHLGWIRRWVRRLQGDLDQAVIDDMTRTLSPEARLRIRESIRHELERT